MQGWIALVVSLLALALSGTTAYFVNFLQVDDMRVITSVDPNYKYEGDYSLPGTWDLTFINSGTRPIAVLSIGACFGDIPFAEVPKGNSRCQIGLLPTDAEQFVVKEKEIVQKTVALKPNEQRNGGAHITANHNIQFPVRNAGQGILCFTVSLSTVSKSDINADIELMDYQFTQYGIAVGSLWHPRPQLLWRSTKYIFQPD